MAATPDNSASAREASERTERATISRFVKTDFLVYVIIAFHLCLTIFLAAKLNIWIDEAYTLDTTGGVLRAFHQAVHFELQPPLYFVLLSVWRKLNGSIFFARLFSIVCIAVSLKLAALLVKRFVPQISPALVVALFAFNPLMIWAAIEARVYALSLLISICLLILFYDGYLCPNRTKSARLLYIAASVCALYTHYYLGFLLVAKFCALALTANSDLRRQLLRDYLLSICVVALCFAPMVFVTLSQVNEHTQTIADAPNLIQSLRDLSSRAQDYLLPAAGDRWIFVRRWLLRLGALALIWSLFKSRAERLTRMHAALAVIVCVVALFFLAVLHLTGEELFQPKHTAALFAPLILGALAFVSALVGKFALRACFVVVFCFYAAALFNEYKPLAKKGDWRRVGEYISASSERDAPILVFRSEAALPLRYYIAPSRLVPLPAALRLDRMDLHDFALQDEAQIARAMDERGVANRTYLWLVTDDMRSYLGVDFHRQTLEDYVARNYDVVSAREFYKSEVRLLKRK